MLANSDYQRGYMAAYAWLTYDCRRKDADHLQAARDNVPAYRPTDADAFTRGFVDYCAGHK